jgi:hypothetical protein
MSLPAPLNTRLAQAMMAARAGYDAPWTMSDGPLGRLFERRMQADIAARLPAAALTFYAALRDEVRATVTLAREGDVDAAAIAFDRAEARLADWCDPDPDLTGQIRALGRSWIDQGFAFHALRSGDPAQAEARLSAAMETDHSLERDYEYDLMHIGRVHVVHLRLRLLAGQGQEDAALDCAEAILSYVTGAGDKLPFGTGWSRSAAARIAPDLAAAMACRVAGDCGVLMAGLSPEAATRALGRVPSLDLVSTRRPDDPGLAEIADWGATKRLWAAGDSDGALCAARQFLARGRGQTSLWYAVLLDLLRLSAALRPEATNVFRAEMATRVAADPAPGEILPGALRTAIAKGSDKTTAAPAYLHRMPARPCHLICAGLPRSGTTSLFTLFAGQRAGNEYAEAETITKLVAAHEGRLSDPALDRYLLRRDTESTLAMDATSFLHLRLDRIVPLFPEARFVLPIRDPAHWFESYLKMLLRWHDSFSRRGSAPPRWMDAYGGMLFGHFDWDEIAAPEACARNLSEVAGRFLSHWRDATAAALDRLPEDRRLILRTEALSDPAARGALARFVELEPGDLTDQYHSNASPAGVEVLDASQRAMVADLARDLAGDVLARVLEGTGRAISNSVVAR